MNDVETLPELCTERIEKSLAKSAVLRTAQQQQQQQRQQQQKADREFQLLLRHPLVPQKCALYGFFVAGVFGPLDDSLQAFATGGELKPREFSIVTDLNFTTCRHTERIIMKNLRVGERQDGKTSVINERHFRCYAKFKLHPESDDEIFVVMDETVTAQYYCAVVTKLPDLEAQFGASQRKSSAFRVNGMLHFVPIQNCTFNSAGHLNYPLKNTTTWFYGNGNLCLSITRCISLKFILPPFACVYRHSVY